MLFNSVQFLVFLPVVFCLYWFVFQRNLRLQNLFIVVVSYVFYGWWDWRFLILIAFTSLWAWLFGILDGKYARGRTLRLALSLVINLGILGYFKYLESVEFSSCSWPMRTALPRTAECKARPPRNSRKDRP